MGHAISWLIEGYVIYAQYYGVVDLSEYDEGGKIYAQMIKAGNAPVHILVDAIRVTKGPHDVAKMVELIRDYQSPGIGWVLTVTQNKLERFFASLVMQMFNSNMRTHMFASMDEVPVYLSTRDPRLEQEQIAEAIRQRSIVDA